MTNGLFIEGNDGVRRPLQAKAGAEQTENPWTKSVSDTWSWNSNNPGQIQHNRTVTHSRVVFSGYMTPQEYENFRRQMDEWANYQIALTRRAAPARPSLIQDLRTIGNTVGRAIQHMFG